jgi:hypothetical protein
MIILLVKNFRFVLYTKHVEASHYRMPHVIYQLKQVLPSKKVMNISLIMYHRIFFKNVVGET